MITEEQKYFSGILKNIGFALLTPLASIVFQAIVFNKGSYPANSSFALFISIFGWLMLYLGYIPIKEKDV